MIRLVLTLALLAGSAAASYSQDPYANVYIGDGGPVLFKHEHGASGAMAAIRPATKAGSYRIALGRDETHIVDNQSDLPSDFLQVELKTEVDPKTFSGRRFRDPADSTDNSSAVEFDTPQLRIVRVVCRTAVQCARSTAAVAAATLQVSTDTGESVWLAPGATSQSPNRGEYLLFEFNSGPR